MTVDPWPADGSGVLELPSGPRVRGRGLRQPLPDGPMPTLALHLSGRLPPEPAWERTWVRWPDFWLPSDPAAAWAALRRAYELAGRERVEIACGGGTGRTGTALAALAVLDGLSPTQAVRWVRERYHPRAVEVPWQRLFLRRAEVERARR